MNASVENCGNIYHLPDSYQVHDNSDEANNDRVNGVILSLNDGITGETQDYCIDQALSKSRKLKDGCYEVLLFDEVFDYMIAEYENIHIQSSSGGVEYVLDPYLKDAIKNFAREILYEPTSKSIFEVVYGIVIDTVGVIQMADDCSVLVSSECPDIVKLIKSKVSEYINYKKGFGVNC